MKNRRQVVISKTPQSKRSPDGVKRALMKSLVFLMIALSSPLQGCALQEKVRGAKVPTVNPHTSKGPYPITKGTLCADIAL